jgi:putative transposase
MKAAIQLGQEVGVRRACEALGVPRAAFYRRRAEPPAGDDRPRPPSPRALSPEERQQVKDVLYGERRCSTKENTSARFARCIAS